MKAELVLANGTVYDPANGIAGERMDICIREGKIVERVSEGAQRLDLAGKVVMPGGVDVHTHVTGSKVNAGRIMRPEDVRSNVSPRTPLTRSASGFTVPNVYQIGYTYARMGYTTLVEAAVPPLKARHTHEELSAIPILDKASLVLMGNNWLIMKYLSEGRDDLLREYVAWLLEAAKGYGIKIVNPGGTEAWGWGRNVEGVRDKVPHFGITPAEIIKGLLQANEGLNLPTSVHLHANRLGKPGNYSTTLETMELVRNATTRMPRGQVLHVVHLQFHSYGGDGWRNFRSEADKVAAAVNSSSNITVDAGAVVFGWSTTMTADGPFEHDLQRLTHLKWTNADVEAETGAGVVPHFYSMKNAVSVVQWCTGLELLLLIKPDRIFLTTDHPNAGSFSKYPQIIHLLMSRKYRDAMMEKLNPVCKKSVLASLDREYTLYDIVKITRAGTAKALGLLQKGHLAPGADADVAVYDLKPDSTEGLEKALSSAHLVLKDGTTVVRDGRILAAPIGRTYWVKCPPTSKRDEMIDGLREHFRYYTIQLGNYPASEEHLMRSSPVVPEVSS